MASEVKPLFTAISPSQGERDTEEAITMGDHRLAVVPLSERSWRLCDIGADDGEPYVMLAYIEQSAAGFTVSWVCRPGTPPQRFDTPLEIVAEAERLLAEADRSGSRRPTPIPHFQPRRRAAAASTGSRGIWQPPQRDAPVSG